MNLKKIYKMIFFKPVFECTPDQLVKMLKIRNETNIRNNMFNPKVIQLDEHIAWSKKIKIDKKDFYLTGRFTYLQRKLPLVSVQY